MAKRKHTSEWMLERIEEYLTGKGSYREIVLDVIRFCNASFFQHGANYSICFFQNCIASCIHPSATVPVPRPNPWPSPL